MGVQELSVLLMIVGFFGVVLAYTRPPPGETIFVPRSTDDSSPQQVHISQVGHDRMRISWITDRATPPTVYYGPSPAANAFNATGNTSSYYYMNYVSGQIHDVVIGPLNPSTLYYYRLGDLSSLLPPYSLKTPPSNFPIKFAIVGDLGQTNWTQSTLQHVANSSYDMLLLPGDLSYADEEQTRWDSYGRLVEPLASQRPWMVTQGNHELDNIPGNHIEPFIAYNARWKMPFQRSGSDSNLYYSFEVAGVHVIMLASYADFDSGSPQYNWLVGDLKKVDRTKTPWIVVLLHAPWYNSNSAHQGEPQSYAMKAAMEDLLYSRADVVFAGHVHAYERFTRVYKDKADNCGSVYITIGDGGNREGLATKFLIPKPEISIFREASFGHGILEVVNATHALWTWHRNEDKKTVVSDSVWLKSLSTQPCKVY